MQTKSAALPLAITSGEPCGIGPDICLESYLACSNPNWVVVGDMALLKERATLLGLDIQFSSWQPASQLAENKLNVLHVPLKAAAEPGKLNSVNASYVLETLNAAADGCVAEVFSGMVTAPVQKSIINDAGYAFSGHTEYLAERVGGYPVMMLAADGTIAEQRYTMRVALATTHLPLRDVADAITAETISTVVEIIDRDLRTKFGLSKPKILVCGLNPHAGEGGHLGLEEIDVIIPALEKLKARGINLVGPLPADTLFIPRHLLGADAVLAMYHDQGLPVLKHYGFGNGTNITLGLPIIRTSVDHGTALDLAGSGKADYRSMATAISTAQQMSNC